MILQCAVIFGCLAIGEILVRYTGIKLPSSIIGMLLLTLFLKIGIVKIEKIKKISDYLVANIGFFFIPPGVALILYFDVIKDQLWSILVATAVSTVVVLAITGWAYQVSNKTISKRKK